MSSTAAALFPPVRLGRERQKTVRLTDSACVVDLQLATSAGRPLVRYRVGQIVAGFSFPHGAGRARGRLRWMASPTVSAPDRFT